MSSKSPPLCGRDSVEIGSPSRVSSSSPGPVFLPVLSRCVKDDPVELTRGVTLLTLRRLPGPIGLSHTHEGTGRSLEGVRRRWTYRVPGQR